MSNLKMKDQKKRAVKTRPFGREASILSDKCAKCVIFKRNMSMKAHRARLGHPGADGKAQWAVKSIHRGMV
jgi:hypothetical protein